MHAHARYFHKKVGVYVYTFPACILDFSVVGTVAVSVYFYAGQNMTLLHWKVTTLGGVKGRSRNFQLRKLHLLLLCRPLGTCRRCYEQMCDFENHIFCSQHLLQVPKLTTLLVKNSILSIFQLVIFTDLKFICYCGRMKIKNKKTASLFSSGRSQQERNFISVKIKSYQIDRRIFFTCMQCDLKFAEGATSKRCNLKSHLLLVAPSANSKSYYMHDEKYSSIHLLTFNFYHSKIMLLLRVFQAIYM